MNDLIRRKDAIDVILECCPSDCANEYECGYDDGLRKGVHKLKHLPSAQPEIIHCEDCKHRFVDGENVRFNCCELNHNKVQSDEWFCADGERRSE